MKYRKKPIIIEAVQWFPAFEGHEFFLETLEGLMKVSPGDYVITGTEGERYPCKAHIFEKIYEKVEE